MKQQNIKVHKTVKVERNSQIIGEQRTENTGEHSHLQKRKKDTN